MKPRLPAHWQTIPAFPTASLILLFRFSHLMMISVGLKVTQPLTNFELSNRMVYFPPNMSVFSFHHLLTFPTLSTKYTFIEMSQYSLDVTGDLVWCRQGSTIGQMGLMMATDDVGCTAKSITTCNNLSWSSVSLYWGEENPRETLHRVQVAPLIKSLCPCEYLAVSCNLQGLFSAWKGCLTHSWHPLYFPGSTKHVLSSCVGCIRKW